MSNTEGKRFREQLDRITHVRAETNSTCWTVFSVFAAAMSVLLAGLAQAKEHEYRVAIAVVGAFTSLMWGALQRRSLGHLELQENIIETLEEQLDIPASVSPTKRNRDAVTRIDSFWCPFRARDLMSTTIGLCFLAWLITAVILVTWK